ncbi:MAG: prepilin-type N-terminal cleavage/methylation domain-containing protein [Candidatus Margulisiibacteriota bacterium]
MRSDHGLNKNGFTLAELLIALIISALVLNSAFLFAFGALGSQKKAAILLRNFQEASSSLGLITKDIRAASAISPSSTDTKLLLFSGADLITYEFVSGKIKRSKNMSGQYITADGSLYKTAFSYPLPDTARIEIRPKNTSLTITAEACCRNI